MLKEGFNEYEFEEQLSAEQNDLYNRVNKNHLRFKRSYFVAYLNICRLADQSNSALTYNTSATKLVGAQLLL